MCRLVASLSHQREGWTQRFAIVSSSVYRYVVCIDYEHNPSIEMKSHLLLLLILLSMAIPCAAEETEIAALAQQYCVACHDAGGDAEGDVELSGLTPETLKRDPELIRKLIHVLDNREMPPEDEPEPTAAQRDAFQSQLQAILPTAIANSTRRQRTPIRRMNRFQYNNAVADLFELNCTVFTLPERVMREHKGYFDPASGKMPDSVTVGNRPLGKSQMIEPRLAGVAAFPQDLRAEHGYDNRGDHLSLSPLLMDQLVKLGRSITESPDFDAKRVGIWDEFFAAPDSDQLQEEIHNRLQRFLTTAFRRIADPALVDRYAGFVNAKLKAGDEFTAAMKAAAAAAIASPRFLYLYDADTGESQDDDKLVNDYELASRLSFFLWGSLPDESLLGLADEGVLSDPEVLRQQTERMLQDKKVKRFCDSFPTQWLQLDRIVSSVPNQTKFPNFYFSKYRASMHMMMEPLLLFETVLIEDLPITQLIDSDFTYRSAKLQQCYGPLATPLEKSKGGGVTVLTFHRVPVSDRRNGGVITNAAVMTMTSGPDRTQPITRGAWIAGVIFNDPPEPPPADVPPLPEKEDETHEKMTLRERLAAHRERADCRGCHEQIDPLGFALENYDPVGVWRDEYDNGLPVDVSGELFREHKFADVAEFKAAILADKDRFCRALAGHLLSFALARELGPADQIALDEITAAVAADDYKMKTLIHQIILSGPFRAKS